MAKTGKRLKKAYEGIDPRRGSIAAARRCKLIKSRATAKFDETVEVAMNLNIDPRKPDQNVRGTVMLPHGTGKTVRVAVFAKRRPRQGGARPPAPTSSAPRIWPRRCRPGRSISTAHRHARHDGARRPARQDPRPARADAEPAARHRHAERRRGGARRPRAARSSSAPRRPGIVHAGVGKASFTDDGACRIMSAPLSARSPGPSRAASRAPTSRRSA